MPRSTSARSGAAAGPRLVVAALALAAAAATAVVWLALPSGGSISGNEHAAVETIPLEASAVDVASSHALPARGPTVERSCVAELARAWTSPSVVSPVLAIVALSFAAGSAGFVGGSPGWASARRGRAPPRRAIRSVR